MHFLHRILLSAVAAASLVLRPDGLATTTSSAPYCGLTPGRLILGNQRLQGEEFIGAPTSANPLHPKTVYQPRAFSTHLDSGNTRTLDFSGPLGRNMNITSTDIRYGQLFWDDEGTPYATYGGVCNGNQTDIRMAFLVLNPETFGIEATWELPEEYANATLNTAYAQLLSKTSEILFTTQEGQLFIIKKTVDGKGNPTFKLRRTIDLTPSGVLGGRPLLNSQVDTLGNIWFTSGELGASSNGAPAANATIIGYVESNDTIHHIDIPNQTVENGIAVSNTTLFFVTGPSAEDDHANAIGHVLAVEPSPAGVQVKWRSTYPAGDGRKPGSFARGSGTTPGFLGNEFFVVTDNSNVQMNLMVFHQNATGEDAKPVCTIPMFEPYASWTDNSLIKYFDGENYAVIGTNLYNEIPYNQTFTFVGDNDSTNNNLTVQSPGLQKIFISADGSDCHVEWTNPVRMNTSPVLSTKTGLIYGYTQSVDLANEGEYVWYANAIDYKTGETVWQARTGAGGIFNNYYRTAFLGPDGTFYHPVVGGVVSIKDGNEEGDCDEEHYQCQDWEEGDLLHSDLAIVF